MIRFKYVNFVFYLLDFSFNLFINKIKLKREQFMISKIMIIIKTPIDYLI
jgi:hypothetical protein